MPRVRADGVEPADGEGWGRLTSYLAGALEGDKSLFARREEVDEYGGRATVLDWAQQRPLTAIVMVLVVWLAFIFLLNTVYGLFL